MKKHDSSPNYHAPARVKKTNVFTSIVWLIPLIALMPAAGFWLKTSATEALSLRC